MEQEREDLTKWKFRWRKIHNWTESLAKVLTLLGGILAFAAGAYDTSNKVLSFSSGCASAIALSLHSFSAYAEGESLERAQQLQSLDIEQLNV